MSVKVTAAHAACQPRCPKPKLSLSQQQFLLTLHRAGPLLFSEVVQLLGPEPEVLTTLAHLEAQELVVCDRGLFSAAADSPLPLSPLQSGILQEIYCTGGCDLNSLQEAMPGHSASLLSDAVQALCSAGLVKEREQSFKIDPGTCVTCGRAGGWNCGCDWGLPLNLELTRRAVQ